MNLSLRQIARSRPLRVLGVMAWLMFVTTSLFAAPMLSAGRDGGHGTATLQLDRCCQDGAHVKAAGFTHCHDPAQGHCLGHAGVACHCAAVGGTAVASASVDVSLAWIVIPMHLSPEALRAPARMPSPPLRPPLV